LVETIARIARIAVSQRFYDWLMGIDIIFTTEGSAHFDRRLERLLRVPLEFLRVTCQFGARIALGLWLFRHKIRSDRFTR